MKTAKEDLIHEHKVIQIALNILERIGERSQKDEIANYGDIKDLLGFLTEFADKCHHGKEEGFLFPALEKAGIRNEGGPIGVMLSEHTQGRNFIKQMQNSIEDEKVDKNQFVGASINYIRLLRAHIQKENSVLFPLIDTSLSASEQKEMYENFENHEEKVIGEGRHEELHVLLEKLAAKYLN
jgi:hemerythrin-like domain-containing protein